LLREDRFAQVVGRQDGFHGSVRINEDGSAQGTSSQIKINICRAQNRRRIKARIFPG